jgi:hypothetical protein
MVRMNFQLCQRDTRTPGCIVMLSQAKHLWLSFQRCGKKDPRLKAWPRGLCPLRCSFASLRMTKVLNEKTRIEFDSGFLKSYPADAVQADHPFPFSHGWMTVATASDFQ